MLCVQHTPWPCRMFISPEFCMVVVCSIFITLPQIQHNVHLSWILHGGNMLHIHHTATPHSLHSQSLCVWTSPAWSQHMRKTERSICRNLLLHTVRLVLSAPLWERQQQAQRSSFHNAAPTLWNRLPRDMLHKAENIESFWWQLKSYLVLPPWSLIGLHIPLPASLSLSSLPSTMSMWLFTRYKLHYTSGHWRLVNPASCESSKYCIIFM